MPEKTTLQALILDYIAGCEGCGEFQLMSYIEAQRPKFFGSLGIEPSLFKKHFFLFNYLYKLNDQLVSIGKSLLISALDIRICCYSGEGREIGYDNKLREFYLNEDNLALSDTEIENMMNKFWRKYLALDKRTAALKTLGLQNEVNLDFSKLKKKYNQLARKHHPDKGGDERLFVEIKIAYNDLKPLLN